MNKNKIKYLKESYKSVDNFQRKMTLRKREIVKDISHKKRTIKNKQKDIILINNLEAELREIISVLNINKNTLTYLQNKIRILIGKEPLHILKKTSKSYLETEKNLDRILDRILEGDSELENRNFIIKSHDNIIEK